MYNYEDINYLHLELSSDCNARCPGCPRNQFGYNHANHANNLTLNNIHTLFPADFLQQLQGIMINGNYGDAVMNPELIDIVKYIREHTDCEIMRWTNGGAGRFWSELAHYNLKVIFGIDGLEDTHSIYRQNTRYKTVLNNAKSFIQAGGQAVWQFILFDHNRHQVAQAEALSKQLGFDSFDCRPNDRGAIPVFDNQGKFVRGIDGYTGSEVLSEVVAQRNIAYDIAHSEVTPWCQQHIKAVYVSADGTVYPCCWSAVDKPTNSSIIKMVKMNNALKHGLPNAVKWFSLINPDCEKVCHENCGR